VGHHGEGNAGGPWAYSGPSHARGVGHGGWMAAPGPDDGTRTSGRRSSPRSGCSGSPRSTTTAGRSSSRCGSSTIRDPRGELWVWNLNRARRTARLEAGGRCGVTIDAGIDYHELRGITARATPPASRTTTCRSRSARLRAQVLRQRRAAPAARPPHVVRARAVRRAQLGLPPARRLTGGVSTGTSACPRPAGPSGGRRRRRRAPRRRRASHPHRSPSAGRSCRSRRAAPSCARARRPSCGRRP
jgi:hypothetical protein